MKRLLFPLFAIAITLGSIKLSHADIQCHEEVTSSTKAQGRFTYPQWKEIQRNWCERDDSLDEYLPYDECKNRFLLDLLSMLRENNYDLEEALGALQDALGIDIPEDVTHITQKQRFIRSLVDSLFAPEARVTVDLDSHTTGNSKTQGFMPAASLQEVYGGEFYLAGENTPGNLLLYGGHKFFRPSIIDLPLDEIQRDFDFYSSFISNDPEQVFLPSGTRGGYEMSSWPEEVRMAQPDIKEPYIRAIVFSGETPGMAIVEYVFNAAGRTKIKNISRFPLGRAEVQIKRDYLGGRIQVNSKYVIQCR